MGHPKGCLPDRTLKYDRKMNFIKARCLLLACGNTLRGDDGIGPWLADWAEERFADVPGLRVISRQQWTPELAADIAEAESVLFVDCSTALEAGSVEILEVRPAQQTVGVGTHQVSAAELLCMAQELYGSMPRRARLLTVGAGSTELSEEFSAAVLDSIPVACAELEAAVEKLLAL
jgi:hydrogenase maturation protease